jgi:hypothetical protein
MSILTRRKPLERVTYKASLALANDSCKQEATPFLQNFKKAGTVINYGQHL